MVKKISEFTIYLEVGQKRVFAGALDWPGLCRSGRDEESALRSLIDYTSRYLQVIQPAGLDTGFEMPSSADDLEVAERLAGGSGTDFGAPEAVPAADTGLLEGAELARQQAILAACWAAFDKGAQAAQGKKLAKGPRGGGRDLDKIVAHVWDAELAYLRRIGGNFKASSETSIESQLAQTRQAVLDGLAAANQPDAPKQGPRGGKYWSPRYLVRRAAWHVLDHLWEIEDRNC